MYAESSGQLDEFLQIAKKRKWQILLPAVIVLSLSLVVAIVMPRKYHAEAEFELRHVRVEGDWQFKDSSSTSLEVSNADKHLTNHERVRAVLQELQWDDFENLRANGGPAAISEYIKRQRKAIGVVKNIREKERKASAFIEVKYKHVDADRAKQFLIVLVEMWAEELVQRDEALLTSERDELQNHNNRRRREYEEIMADKERIEQELGVFSWSEEGKAEVNKKEDPYIQELTTVNIELSRLRRELAGKESQLEELNKKIRVEPEFITKPIIAENTGAPNAVTRLEAELGSLKGQQVGLTPLNSTWQRLQMEIEAKEGELEIAQRAPTERILREERVPNPKVAGWRADIDKIEIEVEQLNGEIGQASMSSQDLFDSQKHRLSLKSQLEQIRTKIKVKEFLWEEAEKTLQGKKDVLTALMRANQEPFIWTTPPQTPEKPSEPNPVLIIAIGLVGGLAIGLGSSMLAEFTKSCYRSVSDVSAVMTIPVLGVVNRIVTKRERRAAQMRGLVVLSSSAVILFVIGWFTWAYTTKPEILPTEFLRRFEDIRSNFK